MPSTSRRPGVRATGSFRPAVLAWAVVAAVVSPVAFAADHGGHAAPAAKAAAPAAKADAKAEAPAGDITNIDALRSRLAEKVAAVKSSHGDAGAAKVTRAAHGGATRHARAGGHGAAPDAAALAAAHRSGGDEHGEGHAAHWAYSGDGGPAAWAKMKPEFATCGIGQRQSPIDIRGGIQVDLDPIKFNYKSAGFNVVDNGHTVQVNIGGGNAIEIGGRRYDLLQFHFHRPSEERVNGRQFEMVAHLVHKDPEGRLAVVALLLDAGKAHPVVQQVWNNLPLEKNVEQAASGAIDLSQLLPEDRRYYTYMGSLTTPPCSEGVLWLVMKQPVSVTQEQIGVFSRLYANNARPIQPAAGRLIKESN